MKKLNTLFIALLIVGSAISQIDDPCESCLPEGIYFSTQSLIDSFPINYPNCAEIEGEVSIGGSVWGNDIINLDGLNNLTSIGGLTMSFLQIPDLNAFENLVTIEGNFVIFATPNLTSLDGLDNLTHIGGLFQIGFESFESNITNLNALYNLTSIDGSLTILWHPLLTSLYGLENIDAGSIDNLTIRSNTALSSCDVQSICDYLVSPNGTVEFYDNATGCNSPEEVQDSCEAHAGIIAGISLANRLLIYPNPAHASITIELQTQPSNNTTLTLSSTNGQQLITQRIRKPQTEIDISHLPVGIYIVKVWNDREVMVQKVIKQ